MKLRENTYVVIDGVAYVDVSTPKHPNTITVIDEADAGFISGKRWSANLPASGYTLRVSRRIAINGKQTTEWLNRTIIGLGHGDAPLSDHRDGDGLNNRRNNLRRSTPRQNQGNRRANKNGSSGFKGVTLDRRNQRWNAQIMVGRKHIHLGRFDTAEDAARAYDARALIVYGEFALTNFQRSA